MLAEDDPVFQTLLRKLLRRWGYDVELVTDGDSAWKALEREDPPRLAILDWVMPGIDGIEVCRRVRASVREPYIYILLLTGRTDAEDVVAGMEAGADDYLKKPFDAHELRARLRAGRRIVELQEELLRAREALRKEATHDGLTGVLNRASVLEALQSEIARGSRNRQPMALLMADIDSFKQVNDTLGHLTGDAVLRETAQRMKASLRRYDCLGRYGGEEFLAVLPECDLAAGRQLAERVRRALAAEPFLAGGRALQVTCSIGVAWRAGGEQAHADALIREADVALYVAKRAGRNRVETVDDAPADLRLLAGALREPVAIEADEPAAARREYVENRGDRKAL